MTWTPIDLHPGLYSDDTAFEKKNTYQDASNVHFRKSHAEVTKGWERLYTGQVPGVCRNALPWFGADGRYVVGMGTHTNLILYKDGSTYDLTPVGLPAGLENSGDGPGYGYGAYGDGPWGEQGVGNFARTWSLYNWGSDLMATPRSGALYWWQNGDVTTSAAIVSSAPATNNLMLVTPQRQVWLLGSTEVASGAYNPLCIRASDLEDPTTWQPATSNNAFEQILEGSGTIIGARLFNDGVIIWTESRCFFATLVGETDTLYSFAAIDGAPGIMSANSAVVLGQSVIWMTPDALLYSIEVGSNVCVPIECPIWDDSLGGYLVASQLDKVTMGYVRETNEVRIDYPDSRDGIENSRYLLLNMTDGSWSRGMQARACYVQGPEAPLGMMPNPNTMIPVAFDYSFNALATNGVTCSGGTLTPAEDGLIFASTSDGAYLSVSGLSFAGNPYRYVSLTISRITNRSEGGFAGYIEYGATGHTDGLNYRSQQAPDIGLGTTATLLYDMWDLQVGDPDWEVNLVTNLQIRLDYGSGGMFKIHEIKVYGDPAPSLTTTIAYNHEVNSGGGDGGPISWFLQTNFFSLDEDDAMMLVRGFKPDFKGQQGVVNLTLFFQDTMGDATATQFGPFPISPNTPRVDLIANGKLASIRLDGESAPTALRLGRSLFDVVPMGTW